MAGRLRFGVYDELHNGYGVDDAKTVWGAFHLAELADQLGYDTFAVIEHHFFQEFSVSANALAFFSALAQKTNRIRFRTLCHNLPMRNPAVFAGEVAVADILTGGRLEVGVGRGHAWEYPAAGIPMEETQGRYEESLEIIELAWTRERFSYDGRYYRLNDVAVVPKPVQKPHPPVYMVGTSGAAFERGARKGWALAFGGPVPVAFFKPGIDRYREACAKHGVKPTVAAVRTVYLGEDEQRIRAELEPALKPLYANRATAIPTLRRDPAMKQRLIDSNHAFYASDVMDALPKLRYEQIVNEQYIYAGSAQQVLDQCGALLDEVAIDELLI